MINQSIEVVTGSMQDLAERENMTLAETFMQAKVVILLDCSGSMDINDAGEGKSRRQRAKEELINLQGQMPGEIALVCFADEVGFSPPGIPIPVGCGTDLTKGLQYIKMADGTDIRFIVISDGEPDNKMTALGVAKTFKNKIDTIFVGSIDYDSGRDFLIELAKVSGGEHITLEKCKELSSGIIGLLTSGKE